MLKTDERAPATGRESCEASSLNPVERFYDRFLYRLVSDYGFGNKRLECAIQFALRALPHGELRVLDIGFGIGWSSQEIIRHLPQAKVDGIDLSSCLVDFANRLCRDSRATFQRQDLTEWTPDATELYDAVLMLDVYEHIPQSKRTAFHAGIRRVLKRGGIVILTCPSQKHQEHLRKANPSGLQPIDEDITRQVAEVLAKDVGLELLVFDGQHIWSTGDYNHILIGPATLGLPLPGRHFVLQSPEKRRARLLKNCGIRVHGRDLISPARDGLRICVAAPQLDAYSETFIRQHIERLPFDVVTLTGPNTDSAADGWLLRRTVTQRVIHRLLRKIERFSEYEFSVNRIARWLAEERIGAVLAEYGFSGLNLADACERAAIPLIIHFHGYDAYNEDAISPYRDRYRRMLGKAAAIIGVSRAMCARLEEIGAPREKTHYIPYSADMEQFDDANPGDAPPVFLAVGRFVEKKAPHLTILAFNNVLKVRPEARLEMVGDGPLLGACKWLACSLKVEHAVVFHGSKDHQWVAASMSRVRAFVQHSVRAGNGDSEGTPVAVLEAQCAGLPVIATSHAGIADVVVDGKTGYLCDEGDVDNMAKLMIRVCDGSPEVLRKMGDAARERYRSEFSYERTLGKLADVIKGCAQK